MPAAMPIRWNAGEGDELAGGLYGVSLGAAFFGESMFSANRDASKVALVHLVEMLSAGGFLLLDTQFLTAHLAQFGAVEIPREIIWPPAHCHRARCHLAEHLNRAVRLGPEFLPPCGEAVKRGKMCSEG